MFTSNVFAIPGLRSLYFALAGMIDKFRYLKVSLALVLMVVGVKMMTHVWLKSVVGPHFNLYLLAVVLLILTGGVVASLLLSRREKLRKNTASGPAAKKQIVWSEGVCRVNGVVPLAVERVWLQVHLRELGVEDAAAMRLTITWWVMRAPHFLPPDADRGFHAATGASRRYPHLIALAMRSRIRFARVSYRMRGCSTNRYCTSSGRSGNTPRTLKETIERG